MNELRRILKKLTPYLILLLFTFFACYILFMTSGYLNGDDTDYHFANIYDEYKAILEGNTSMISPYLASGVGVGKKLFYSPLPHFIVAFSAVILSIFNITILQSFKIVIFLSIYISGIFMYHFALHITKGKMIPSLIGGAIFILYPYRLFDFYCRIAFAEAFSIMFLPLFYMGLYDILNNKDETILPYIEVVLGATLLYLSHNLTALYAFIFGVIYILFNYKKALKIIKNKRTIIYSCISIFLIVGLSLYNIVTQSTMLMLDFYNVSEPERMWTTISQVSNRTHDCFSYSGFLNLLWMTSNFSNVYSSDSLIVGLILFIIFSSVTIIIDICLSKINKLKYFHYIVSFIIYFILLLSMINRIEIVLGGIIFSILYLYVNLSKEKNNKINILKNPDFYYFIVMGLVVMTMITQDFIWSYVPSMLLKIQFPWRLWAFISLYISILFVYILNSSKSKNIVYASTIIVGFLSASAQPQLEKRLVYNYTESPSFTYELNESLYNNFMSIGANLEYYPKCFYLGSKYESNYKNSLYYDIYHEIWYSFNKNPYSFNPVVLEGNATIVVNSKKAPIYDMTIEVSEKALIQVPLLYYPGYKIEVLNNQNISNIDAVETDGLVSFYLDSGSYTIKTNYEGTTVMKFSNIIRYISFDIFILFISYGIIILNKKEITRGINYNRKDI